MAYNYPDRKPVMRYGASFSSWMESVDAQILKLTNGLTSESLPHCNYKQWHADGATTKSAAERAVKKWNQSKLDL